MKNGSIGALKRAGGPDLYLRYRCGAPILFRLRPGPPAWGIESFERSVRYFDQDCFRRVFGYFTFIGSSFDVLRFRKILSIAHERLYCKPSPISSSLPRYSFTAVYPAFGLRRMFGGRAYRLVSRGEVRHVYSLGALLARQC
jgi:hypothetical protein